MATTITEDEEIPGSYPNKPSGMSKEAGAINHAMIWSRIEAYISRRYTSRGVVWIAEGPGEWVPPLQPAEISTKEVWEGDAWVAFTPTPSPLGGFMLYGAGPYRFTAAVGGGDVPAAVREAYRRLAEYLAQAMANAAPGIRTESADGFGQAELDGLALARAMQYSGAADLLRPYRRAS